VNFTALQERQPAEQMVERFVDRFQPSYRLLAYYAALPLLLTPELVNYLRVEFLRDENVPWEAEVDLLLSDLCRQVGYELYAMDTAVRAYLLEEMKRELGIEKMQEVAKSLIGYIRYLFQNNPSISAKELQAQQWAAMVYLEETREQVVREIAEGFENYATSATGKGLVNLADLARLANITKELAPELGEYQVLVDYANILSRLLANDEEMRSEDLMRDYNILPDKKLDLPQSLIPDKFKPHSQAYLSPFGRKGSITNPEDFFGREALIEEIFQLLAVGRSISLVGESGIGKSSILRQICNRGKERLWSINESERNFAYLDLQLIENEADFYKYLCDELGIPTVREYELYRALENKYYVVCIDEIEKLTNSNFSSDILAQLRGLAQNDAHIQLVIASRSYLDNLFPSSEEATSTIANIFTVLNIPHFSFDETLNFIKSRLIGTGLEFNEQQINQLLAETQGHPGRLQEAAAKLYKQIISSRAEVVNLFPELNIFQFETATVNNQGKITQREQLQARYFAEPLSNNITLEMVEIPAGTFIMGAPASEEKSSDDERPQHEVNIPSFFMGKYPVTQAQWKFVAALPQVNRKLKPDPFRFKGENRPVEQVSWFDAVEFCDRISQYTGKNYRLPSEAEWEYACRAGTITPFHFGETITSELANYNAEEYTYGAGKKGTNRGKTTEVGHFGVGNAFGLYDMHGNVWEWCADQWHSNYEGAPTDGSAWIDDNSNNNNNQSRLLRGGSWYYYPEHCHSAYRNFSNPVSDIFTIGFRLVCGVFSSRTLPSP
jgi:formylglycine-generating enzyme required for sulfatase activity